MRHLDLKRARNYALHRLAAELSPDLYYHSLAHTQHEVLRAAEQYAIQEGIAGEGLILLRTGALYHDIGFVECYVGHEAASVRISASVLPEFGYSAAHIDTIGEMIMATEVPQSPRTLLERLLADADLDVLGHDTFLARNTDLRNELSVFSQPVSDAAWYQTQLAFLRRHRYWTAVARNTRDAGKQRNVDRLSTLLHQMSSRQPPSTLDR